MDNKTNDNTYLIVPKEIIDDLRDAVKHLREAGKGVSQVGNRISEEEAKRRLGRETTWFWYMRKKGLLAYTKIGASVFYDEKDIEKLQEVLQKKGDK